MGEKKHIYTDTGGNKLYRRFIKTRGVWQLHATNAQGKMVNDTGVKTMIRRAKRVVPHKMDPFKWRWTEMVVRSWGNPYTHEEHERESLANTSRKHSCDWCGRTPRVLYKYNRKKGWFCGKGCFSAYHDSDPRLRPPRRVKLGFFCGKIRWLRHQRRNGSKQTNTSQDRV